MIRANLYFMDGDWVQPKGLKYPVSRLSSRCVPSIIPCGKMAVDYICYCKNLGEDIPSVVAVTIGVVILKWVKRHRVMEVMFHGSLSLFERLNEVFLFLAENDIFCTFHVNKDGVNSFVEGAVCEGYF
jgi:hypothetical protein